MRLIDADALLKAIEMKWDYVNPIDFVEIVANTPTVQREERDKLVNKTDKGAATLRPIDIEKRAEEHLTPFARTGWTAYGEQLKAFAEALLEDKEREIAELKTTVRSDNSKVIAALNAHINVLRESIAEIAADSQDIYTNEALTKLVFKTPAQSLQEHDNEVIERCAKAAEKNGNGITANKIRALKVTNE